MEERTTPIESEPLVKEVEKIIEKIDVNTKPSEEPLVKEVEKISEVFYLGRKFCGDDLEIDFATENNAKTVSDEDKHGITGGLEIAGQVAGTVPLHRQLSADKSKELVAKKVTEGIDNATKSKADDMRHPGVPQALDICGEIAGAVPLIMSDLSMEGIKMPNESEYSVKEGGKLTEMFDNAKKVSGEFIGQSVSSLGKVKEDILSATLGSKSPKEEKQATDKSTASFFGIQHSDTVIEVNPQSKTSPDTRDGATPYITTPTLSRRGLGVGGSQRLTRDQRPAPLDVTNMPDDDDSEDENYIVTEPSEDTYSQISEESRVHSSPDILSSTKQPPLIPIVTFGAAQERKRRPMFHIESEEDDLTDLIIDYTNDEEMRGKEFISDQEQVGVVRDVDEDEEDVSEREVVKGFMKVGPLGDLVKGVEVVKEAAVSKVEKDVNIIKDQSKHGKEVTTSLVADGKNLVSGVEDKFEEEFEKAMGISENVKDDLSGEVEKVAEGTTDKIEKKLRRVERRFERMASETLEKDVKESAEPDVEQKREADFQRMISQLSTEEVMDCQKDFSQLWEEGGMSMTPSEEWDSASRDPDTPSHELDEDSPQGDTSGEWGPRDPLPQPAPTTRGAEGLMSQGAAGSSSHTITETRVIEGSDDTTMQELLDKLAAEQRK